MNITPREAYDKSAAEIKIMTDSMNRHFSEVGAFALAHNVASSLRVSFQRLNREGFQALRENGINIPLELEERFKKDAVRSLVMNGSLALFMAFMSRKGLNMDPESTDRVLNIDLVNPDDWWMPDRTSVTIRFETEKDAQEFLNSIG